MRPKFLRKKTAEPPGEEATRTQRGALAQKATRPRKKYTPKDTVKLTFRIGGLEKKRHSGIFRTKPKNASVTEQTISQVRDHLLTIKVKGTTSVTKEEVGHILKLRTHIVEQIFHRFNLEGLLQRERRSFAHDTNRNGMFGGTESGWAANRYYFVA